LSAPSSSSIFTIRLRSCVNARGKLGKPARGVTHAARSWGRFWRLSGAAGRRSRGSGCSRCCCRTALARLSVAAASSRPKGLRWGPRRRRERSSSSTRSRRARSPCPRPRSFGPTVQQSRKKERLFVHKVDAAALRLKRPVYSGNKGPNNHFLSVVQAEIRPHTPPGGPAGSACGSGCGCGSVSARAPARAPAPAPARKRPQATTMAGGRACNIQ